MESITNIELLRGDPQKLDVHVDDSEMITHIISNLHKEYQTIVEILEDNLDYDDNPLTIERIRDKLSVKFDRMNEQSVPRTSRDNEKDLYVQSQYKDTCTTCRKYGHKGKY